MNRTFRKGVWVALGGLALLMTLSMSVNAEVDRQLLHPPKAGNMQALTLTDGTTINGQIVETTADSVVFKSSLGETTIAINQIKAIKELEQQHMHGSEYWFPNPNQSRLFLGPTARMLKRGQAYFSDVYIFFPSVGVGLTNNVTIGGGMSLFPGLSFDEQLYYLTPKIGLTAVDRLSLAASALVVFLPDWTEDTDDEFEIDEPRTVGIAFGVATYGSENNSVTVGLGYGFVEDAWADKPAVIFGGEYRLLRRMSLVTENWVLPGVEPPLISYGCRFFGEGVAIDLALMNVASEDAIFPGIPYVDFVWNF